MSLLCAALCLQFAGSVSSIATADSGGHLKFVVIPAPKPEDTDAQFATYGADLGRMLTAEGLTPAASPDAADLIVRLAYAVSAPIKRVTRERPAGRAQGVGAQGTIRPGVGGGGEGFGGVGGGEFQGEEEGDDEGVSRTVTVYNREIIVTAYSRDLAAPTVPVKPQWQVRVKSTGPEGGLPQMVPVMIAMARPYIGKTAGQTDVKVDEKDAGLRLVRGEGAAPRPVRNPPRPGKRYFTSPQTAAGHIRPLGA
jgi:hypothetical protein